MSTSENAVMAAMAYRQAVEDAGNFVDQQMRQYGWTAPDASGVYSTMGAQDAFDPDRVIQFDAFGAPVVDAAQVMQSTQRGQYGTTGLFAETAQQAAAQEADIMAGERMRGFGRGSGLSGQRQRFAETTAARQMGTLSSRFLQDLMRQYQGLTRTYQGVAAGAAQGATSAAGRQAQFTSLYNY